MADKVFLPGGDGEKHTTIALRDGDRVKFPISIAQANNEIKLSLKQARTLTGILGAWSGLDLDIQISASQMVEQGKDEQYDRLRKLSQELFDIFIEGGYAEAGDEDLLDELHKALGGRDEL